MQQMSVILYRQKSQLPSASLVVQQDLLGPYVFYHCAEFDSCYVGKLTVKCTNNG